MQIFVATFIDCHATKIFILHELESDIVATCVHLIVPTLPIYYTCIVEFNQQHSFHQATITY